MSKSEWEAVCMYVAFAFRKKGGEETSTKRPATGEEEEGGKEEDRQVETKKIKLDE